MGFPVGDQVDVMLPLLGLKVMLGSAVVADAAAAQMMMMVHTSQIHQSS